MHRNTPATPSRWAVVLALLLGTLVTPAPGDLAWFDPAPAGRAPETFQNLRDAYLAFIGQPSVTLTFNDLSSAAPVLEQYAPIGVHFQNTAVGRYAHLSRVHPEGGAIVEHVTGYDGSYMPHGDRMLVKFDNHLAGTPLTILFDEPVSLVGAFVGMGVQGPIHSLTLAAFDTGGAQLGTFSLPAWLWESSPTYQNYESFFAVRADQPTIARLEIRNDATADFANGLLLDNLAFDRSVPEPGPVWLLAGGGLLVAALHHWQRRPRPHRV